MRSTVPALLIGLGLTCAAEAAEPDTYIFDVLALQPYKGNFARLVKPAAIPEWVKAISVQGAGTAGPAKTVEVDGTPYRLDRVCKVGACAGNTLDVLWGPRGSRVWAVLVEDGRAPVMLGEPKGAQAKALEAAAGGAAPSAPAKPVAAAPSAEAAAPAVTTGPAAAMPAPGPEPESYIFDVLTRQPYKANFARLVRAKGTPDWVKAISVQGAGTAGPMKAVEVGGTSYRLDRVCKVGACAGNTLDVLWSPRGSRVWAALVEDGKPPVMLGDPRTGEAKVLADAAGTPSSTAAGSPAIPPK